jgi:hypothetical protein
MATKTVRNGSGHSNLDIALTALIQNQAQFVSEVADINRRSNELKEGRQNVSRISSPFCFNTTSS